MEKINKSKCKLNLSINLQAEVSCAKVGTASSIKSFKIKQHKQAIKAKMQEQFQNYNLWYPLDRQILTNVFSMDGATTIVDMNFCKVDQTPH